MIDPRFSLVPDPRPDYKHLFHLQFTVIFPKDYYIMQMDLLLQELKKQYPELSFSYTGVYTAKYPDGQYAVCYNGNIKYRGNFVESMLFSTALELDTIMATTCGFKKAVPPIKLNVDPAALVDMTPEDFHDEVEKMYALVHKISLRVRAVSWQLFTCSIDEPVYFITPIDYDYI